MDVISTAVKCAIVAAVLVTAACSAPAEPTRLTAPLAHTFESADALGQAVLSALERRDRDALRALPLSESEYRDHVWPELPVSRPERNVPFEYSWGQLQQHSDGSLQQTLARYGGRRLTLVDARFTGETTKYASFSVLRHSEIIARDENGRDLILQLYGSAMVKDGRYKMFSYVVDDQADHVRQHGVTETRRHVFQNAIAAEQHWRWKKISVTPRLRVSRPDRSALWVGYGQGGRYMMFSYVVDK